MVFVRYDGSEVAYWTGWQLWKWSNHESDSFVLEYTTAERTVLVFRKSSGPADYVTFVEVGEDELPDGVEVDGFTVRDTRFETSE